MFAEWKVHGKPSVLGIISGAVAGLIAITPASGSVGPMGALAIGAAAGVGCYWAATSLKRAFGYDDSLDVFGVHAVGGIIGAMLTGVFSAVSLGGSGLAHDTIPEQLIAQGMGVGVTIIYTAVVSFIILKVIDALIGLRVDEDSETEGLDVSQHDERGYILN
jgi:Amt family ammonium transporter